jgi:exosortase
MIHNKSIEFRYFLAPVLVVAAVCAVFWKTILETAQICMNNEDYSHGTLLPLISAYFIYQSRERIISLLGNPQGRISFLGVSLLVAGSGLLFVGSVANILFFRWLGLFPALTGALFLSLGIKRGWAIANPLLINFMAKPLPDSLVPKLFFPLQVLAAKVAAWTLDVLQVPVHLQGNIIEIPGMQLMVEEACSGLRSMMALATVAIIVILNSTLSTGWKIVIFVFSIVAAIVLNIFRVTATGVLSYFYDPSAATGFFHTFSGLVVFIVGLVLLSGFASLLERITGRRNQT